MEKKPQQSESRDADKYIVRFPEGMREDIAKAAKSNNRSMNSEIVARLQSPVQSPAATMGVLANLEMMLADSEYENTILRLRLNEFAMSLRIAIMSLPKELIEADALLKGYIEEWESDIAEVSEDIPDLTVEAKKKAGKFVESADRVKKLFEYAVEKSAEESKPAVKRITRTKPKK